MTKPLRSRSLPGLKLPCPDGVSREGLFAGPRRCWSRRLKIAPAPSWMLCGHEPGLLPLRQLLAVATEMAERRILVGRIAREERKLVEALAGAS